MADISTDISGLAWLRHRPPGTAMAEGVQTGSLIGQALLKMKELQMQREQEAAAAPLREAQRQYYLQKTTLDLKAETARAQQDLNMREGFAQLSDVVSRVNEYPEKWLDPSYRKDFWQVAADHPEVAKHPTFDNIIANFTLSERLKAQKDNAEAQIAQRDQIAAEQALARESEQDLKALKITTDLERDTMRTEGKPPTEDKVAKRTRDNWIAKRALELMKDGKPSSEAYRLARLEREVAEGNIDPEDLAKRPNTAPAKGVRRYDPSTGRFSP